MKPDPDKKLEAQKPEASNLEFSIPEAGIGGAKPFQTPTIMGIVNLTPDSFSDGGQYTQTLGIAVRRSKQLIAQGADIIDIGGESTRPGARPVSPAEELQRILGVIEQVSEFATVSVDTRRAEVAVAAIKAGATIVNDVSADLAETAADNGAGWIAMHMQGKPADMQNRPRYSSVVDEVLDYLDRKATHATQLGISQLWIDPGFGFGKKFEHNLELVANIDKFVATGWPVAVGLSRKSMLGSMLANSDSKTRQRFEQLKKANPESSMVNAEREASPSMGGSVIETNRLVGSVATACYAVMQGVKLVRVHDVKEARQAVLMLTGE